MVNAREMLPSWILYMRATNTTQDHSEPKGVHTTLWFPAQRSCWSLHRSPVCGLPLGCRLQALLGGLGKGFRLADFGLDTGCVLTWRIQAAVWIWDSSDLLHRNKQEGTNMIPFASRIKSLNKARGEVTEEMKTGHV